MQTLSPIRRLASARSASPPRVERAVDRWIAAGRGKTMKDMLSLAARHGVTRSDDLVRPPGLDGCPDISSAQVFAGLQQSFQAARLRELRFNAGARRSKLGSPFEC